MNKKPLIGILESVHQDGINLLKKFSNVYLDTGKSKKEIFKNVKRYDVIFIKSNIKINKKILLDIYSKRLPHELYNRKKTGFEIPHSKYFKLVSEKKGQFSNPIKNWSMLSIDSYVKNN